jgi:hypothetical protein
MFQTGCLFAHMPIDETWSGADLLEPAEVGAAGEIESG